MGEATFACVYMVFAILFAWANLSQQGTGTANAMYFAITPRYTNMPFSYRPEKGFHEIDRPPDLFAWLMDVFVPVTFQEKPANGALNGFCTTRFGCGANEGDCDLDRECKTNYTCGEATAAAQGVTVNGNYWDIDDLNTWCTAALTPLQQPLRLDTLLSCEPTPTIGETGQVACCWDPYTDTAIQMIRSITNGPTVTRNCPAFLGFNIDCCTYEDATAEAEPMPDVAEATTSNAQDRRPATVGGFNQVLMTRLSMKRFKTESHDGLFSDSVKTKLANDPAYMAASTDNKGLENTSTFTSALDNTSTYVWEQDGSYLGSGAYHLYLDPRDGKEAYESALKRLSLDGWFDWNMGSLVLDFFVYNGNVDTFMHIAFVFEFDFGGTCRKFTDAVSLNLDLFDPSDSNYTARIIVDYIVLIMVVLFILDQFAKCYEFGLYAHFRRFVSWVDCTSLVMCLLVFISSWVIQADPIFRDFEIEDILNPGSRVDTFMGLTHVAGMFRDQSYIVAVNLLFVFLRAVMMVTYIDSELGMMTRTLNAASSNLGYFTFQFVIMLGGFVFFAFFTFGSRSADMNTPLLTFKFCFSMLCGKPDYDKFNRADPMMAPIFFYSFYVLFGFVMVNMFVSILLSGYDVVEFEQKKREKETKEERNPLKRILQEVKSELVGKAFVYAISLMKFIGMILKPVWLAVKSCVMVFVNCICFYNPCSWTQCKNMFKRKENQDAISTQREMDQAVERAKKAIRELESLEKMGPIVKRKIRKYPKPINEMKHELQNKIEKDNRGDPKEIMRMANQFSNVLWEFKHQDGPMDFLCLVAFMLTFILFMFFQTRGADSYNALISGMEAVRKTQWVSDAPVKDYDFFSITSFAEVYDWARFAIAELYDNPACMALNSFDDGEEGDSSLAPVANCGPEGPKGNNTHQLVQRVNWWNIGFLEKTFVRLTIQPSCYVANENDRWSSAYPFVRAMRNTACATSDCTATAFEENENACYNAAGELIDLNSWNVTGTIGTAQKLKYNYSAPDYLGSSNKLGGFAISLGNRKEEFEAMLERIYEDNMFSQNSASMVFDWITYNGNVDMFTYNVVEFSLLGTGKLELGSRSQTFPLNLLEGGGDYYKYRMATIGLFIAYVVFVLHYLRRQTVEFIRLHKKAKDPDNGSFSRQLVVYFSKIWNLADVISQIVSVVTIVNVLMFAFNPFRRDFLFAIPDQWKYPVPNSDVKWYDMAPSGTELRQLENDWYVFQQFEGRQTFYNFFLTVAAINSFLLSIKVVAFVNRLDGVKVFAGTLSKGLTKNMYFLFVMKMLMVGAALFFNVIFGATVPEMSDLLGALNTLFSWALGDFHLQPYLEYSPAVAILSFALFMTLFYFIAMNMFLATMLNTYSATVGAEDVQHEKARAKKAKEITEYQVEYESKKHLRVDIDFRLEEDSQFTVSSCTARAKKKGVKVEDMLVNVNGDTEELHKCTSTEELFQKAFTKKGKDQVIRLTFKEPQRDESWWAPFMSSWMKPSHKEGTQGIKPTVKNFWRQNGAVNRTYKEVESDTVHKEEIFALHGSAQGDEEDDVDGEEEEEAAATAGEAGALNLQSGDHKEVARKKTVQEQTKKRLDKLLFSRDGQKLSAEQLSGDLADSSSWRNPEPDGPDGRGGAAGAAAVGGDKKREDEYTFDTLREAVQAEPLTGEEVWLDVLITAIEQEMTVRIGEDDSIVTEVLRTGEMQELHNKGTPAQKEKVLQGFNKKVTTILQILEYKANKRYFNYLTEESQQRQDTLQRQNEVLHDYCCELEIEFGKIMGKIHSFREKKEVMLTKLAGLLDRESYRDLAGTGQPQDNGHLARLTRPWPDAHGGQSLSRGSAGHNRL